MTCADNKNAQCEYSCIVAKRTDTGAERDETLIQGYTFYDRLMQALNFSPIMSPSSSEFFGHVKTALLRHMLRIV
jgi:hypothetical protein